MLALSFGSVFSSLRRTSANDRSDEILMWSTVIGCDVKVAGVLALVILLYAVGRFQLSCGNIDKVTFAFGVELPKKLRSRVPYRQVPTRAGFVPQEYYHA